MIFGDQPCEVHLSFQDGDIEGLLVTPMGPNLYRMEESSVFGEVSYHDVIEAKTQTDGTLRFLRVLKPSGLKSACWILSPPQLESHALSALLDRVMSIGGNWEKLFVGVLLLLPPPSEHYQIINQVNAS